MRSDSHLGHGGLVYAGLVCLWLLYLRAIVPGMLFVQDYASVELLLQPRGPLGLTLRSLSASISLLLVAHLWLGWRGTRLRAVSAVAYLTSACLVLLTHLAVIRFLAGLPQIVVLRIE